MERLLFPGLRSGVLPLVVSRREACICTIFPSFPSHALGRTRTFFRHFVVLGNRQVRAGGYLLVVRLLDTFARVALAFHNLSIDGETWSIDGNRILDIRHDFRF